MDQLVCEQMLSGRAVWSILAGAEHDMRADRVCQRIHAQCGLRGLLVGMNTHAAEVVTEACLEERAHRGVQRLAG